MSDSALLVVASYGNHSKLVDFLGNIADCDLNFPNFTILVVNTGETPLPLFEYWRDSVKILKIVPINTHPGQRKYASVMLEKVRAATNFAVEDTILFNLDPDYHYNKHVFRFARTIFKENPTVNYLSLLNAGGNEPNVELSGFKFARAHSCMGGSIIARFAHFLPYSDRFFEKKRVTELDAGEGGQFDQGFWSILEEETGEYGHVYTLCENFSLVQHCNLISDYLSDKGQKGVDNHMYGINYDPRIDPFEIRRLRCER